MEFGNFHGIFSTNWLKYRWQNVYTLQLIVYTKFKVNFQKSYHTRIGQTDRFSTIIQSFENNAFYIFQIFENFEKNVGTMDG